MTSRIFCNNLGKYDQYSPEMLANMIESVRLFN